MQGKKLGVRKRRWMTKGREERERERELGNGEERFYLLLDTLLIFRDS